MWWWWTHVKRHSGNNLWQLVAIGEGGRAATQHTGHHPCLMLQPPLNQTLEVSINEMNINIILLLITCSPKNATIISSLQKHY